MCDILETFLKNLEDVENLSNSLREHLFQAETELTQVTAATRRCEQETVTLDRTKESRLVEANNKDVQLEFLQQKEVFLKKILTLKKEDLNSEKNKVKQLQDEIFTQRTEFCDRVWEFSDFISNEKKKNDHNKQKNNENEGEELAQLEEKKSAIEAELGEINTRISTIVEQICEATTEKEELEAYTNSKEYLELDRKLQSVVEENKILEKVVNTLVATVDQTRKGKTENKQLEVIESTDMCLEDGVVSSRKKVSYYCLETIEERAMHKTQHTSINHSVHSNNFPYKLLRDSSDQQRKEPKSFYGSPQRNIHYAEESVAKFESEHKRLLNETTGNRSIKHLDGVRESEDYLSYCGTSHKADFHGHPNQVRLLQNDSRKSDSSPNNVDLEATNIDEYKLYTNSPSDFREKQFVPEINCGRYKQHQNLCTSNRNSQDAYNGTEGSSWYHKPHEVDYPPSIRGRTITQFPSNAPRETYHPDRYNSRTQHPPDDNSQNFSTYPVHNLYQSNPQYEVRNLPRDVLISADIRNHYQDNTKQNHTLRFPDTHCTPPARSSSQEKLLYYGTSRPDQGVYARDSWPPRRYDNLPWRSPHKHNGYGTHCVIPEDVRNEDKQMSDINCQHDKNVYASHRPEYTNYSREWHRNQQTNIGRGYHHAPYRLGGESKNTISTAACHPSNTDAGYPELGRIEADIAHNLNESKKENSRHAGYGGTWRPKERVSNKLRAFGNPN